MNIRMIKNTYELEIAKFMHSFYYGILKTLVTNLNLRIHNTHIIQEPWHRMAIRKSGQLSQTEAKMEKKKLFALQ